LPDLPHPADAPAPAERSQALDAALEILASAVGDAQGDAFRRIKTFLAKDPGKAAFENVAGRLGDLRLITLLDRMFADAAAERRAIALDLINPSDQAANAGAPSLDRLTRRDLLRRILDDARVRALHRACELHNALQKGAVA
jgi:hypothetical protein